MNLEQFPGLRLIAPPAPFLRETDKMVHQLFTNGHISSTEAAELLFLDQDRRWWRNLAYVALMFMGLAVIGCVVALAVEVLRVSQ